MSEPSVFIVEDEQIISFNIKIKLEAAHYVVTGMASTSAEALEALQHNQPDIILIDITLLDSVDGIELAREIKRKYSIPHIFITAHSDVKTINRAKMTEPYGYIVKPIQDHDLFSTIDIALYKYRMDKKLRESEQKYRSLIENIKDIVFSLDEDWLITYISPRIMDVTGYEPVELAGKNLNDLVSDNDKMLVAEQLNYLKEGNTPDEFEFRVIANRENIVWVRVSIKPIVQDETFHGAKGIMSDITEKKEVQNALYEVEDRHKTLIEYSLTSIIFTRFNGDIIECNKAFVELTGYSREELLSMNINTLYEADSERLYIQKQLKKEGFIKGEEIKLKRKNNQVIYLYVTINVVHIKRKAYFLLNGINISKRKKTEKALVDSQKRYLRIFEETPISLREEDFSEVKIIIDSLRRKRVKNFENYLKKHPELVEKCEKVVRVTDVNDETLRLYKARSKEHLLKKIRKIHTKQSDKTFIDIISTFANGEQLYHGETVNTTLQGDHIDIDLRVHIADGYRDTWEKVLISSVDITEKLKSEHAIKELNEKLEKRVFDRTNELHRTLEIVQKREQELQKSEKRFRSIVENSPMGIQIFKLEGKELVFIGANLAADLILGIDNSRLVGKKILEGFPSLKGTEIPKRYYQAAAKGESWVSEKIDYDENTITGAFQVYAFQINPGLMAAMFLDITQRKQTEQLIVDSEEKYRRLFDEAIDAIFVADIETGIIVDCNRSAELLTERSRNEILGLHQNELYSSGETGRNGSNVFTGQTGSIGKHLPDIQVITKSGTPRDVMIKGNVFDYKGKKYFQGIFRDISNRKHAETALLESEAKYRTLFETMTQGVVYQGKDSRVFSANFAAERILGVNHDHMKGLTLIDPIWRTIQEDGSEFPEEAHPVMVALRTGLEVKNVTMGILNPRENSYRWINVSATPQFKPGEKKPYQVYATLEDITLQMRSRAALQESEQRLRTAVVEAPFPVIIHVDDKEIIMMSNSWCDITGFLRDDFPTTDEWVKKVFPHDYQAYIQEHLAELYDITDRVSQGEFTVKTAAGDKRIWDFSSAPLGILADGRRAVLTMAVDVSDRKKIEEASKATISVFQRSETMSYEELIDIGLEESVSLTNSEIGFFHLVNIDQREKQVTTWSGKTVQIFNIPGGNIHSPIEEAGTGLWEECFHQKKAVIHNDYNSLNYTGVLPSGHVRPVRLMAIPIIEGEKVVAIVGVGNKPSNYTRSDVNQVSMFVRNIWTILQRKRVEEELKSAMAAAESANQAKSEFLSSMSHEIRTPMNAIIGIAEALSETGLTEKQKRYIQIFKTAGDDLLSIINNILDISKIEAGQFELEVIQFDLIELLEKTCDVLNYRASQKGLELILYIKPGTPQLLLGDPYRLRQVLVNIIGNAIKFTNKGFILVDVSLLEKNERGIISTVINFKITDTGIGIPEEKQEVIFETFTQVDTSSTRKYEGTGLGLNIVKRLVAMMEGTLSLESEADRGSCFSFTVPFDVAALTHGQDDLYVVNSGLKILGIDDHPVNRLILQETLEDRHGQTIDLAVNGTDALEKIIKANKASEPYHLLILDQNMPEMSGIETVQVIRQQYKMTQCRIILLSSSIGPIEETRMREMGIDRFLIKPVKRDELRSAVASLFYLQERDRGTTEVSDKKPEYHKEYRVLLVDDSESNRIIVTSLLENLPLAIDIAIDGKQAVQKIKENPDIYDLVLMDMQMPVMDGYTATEKIREWEKSSEKNYSRVPIIALSAYAMTDDVLRSLNAGCDKHITKPIQKNEFIKTISHFLGIKALPVTFKEGTNGNRPQSSDNIVYIDPVLMPYIPKYLEAVNDTIVKMKKSLKERNYSDIGSQAHTLKGEGGTYGFEYITNIGYRMEQCSREHDDDSINKLLHEVQQYIAHVEIRSDDM